MNWLEIWGIIATIALLLSLLVIAYLFLYYNPDKKISKGMVIYGDAKASIQDHVAVYIVENIPKAKYEFLMMDEVKIYASGMEIGSSVIKLENKNNALMFVMTGFMDSPETVLHLLGTIKFDLWEVSFDGGITRRPVKQTIDYNQRASAKEIAINKGWEADDSMAKLMEEDIKRASKNKIGSEDVLVEHSLVADINQSMSTKTTMRYQVVIPNNHKVWDSIETKGKPIGLFYYIYNGKAYRMESKFLGNKGSTYEWDIVGLEPGTVYVGLSLEIENNGVILPSSALYGITHNSNDEIVNLDDAKLAKPKPGDIAYDMWSENIAVTYIGEQYAKRGYDVIVKKHYEDEFEDDYISLQRAHEVYGRYKWLKGVSNEDIENKALEVIHNVNEKVDHLEEGHIITEEVKVN